MKTEDFLYAVFIFMLGSVLILSAVAGGIIGFNDAHGTQLQNTTLQFLCTWGPAIGGGSIGVIIGALGAFVFACVPDKYLPFSDGERLSSSAAIGCMLAIIVGIIAVAALCSAQYLSYALLYNLGQFV